MGVSYLPIIKVFDVSDVDIPKKVTATRKTDGKLWWKYTNTIPVEQHEFSKIKIVNTGIVDRMVSYSFSQCLFNLLLYNNLELDRPQKYLFATENNMCTFTYFIDEDEIIVIPRLPSNNQILKFTLCHDCPVLKLQAIPQ